LGADTLRRVQERFAAGFRTEFLTSLAGKLTFKEISEQANLKEATFYRRLRELRLSQNK
jgi:CRP-like cAMP-binding protein